MSSQIPYVVALRPATNRYVDPDILTVMVVRTDKQKNRVVWTGRCCVLSLPDIEIQVAC